MLVNKSILIAFILTITFYSHKGFSFETIGLPKGGYVPDEETAVKIAEVVLIKYYGKEIKNQKPFKIELKNGKWVIDGTLHRRKNELNAGGTAHIEIDRADGKISNVFHTK